MTQAATTPEPESLRDAILREATRLFATQGYNPTSIRQVCEAAHCTKPSLYYYFANKEELYLKALNGEVAALSDLIRTTVLQPGPVRERLHASLATFVDHVKANPHGMAMLHRAEMENEQGRPAVDVGGSRRMQMEMIAELVRQGIEAGEIRADVSPGECAVVLAGTISFQFQLWVLCGEPWPEGQLERTLDLIFEGIAP